MRGSHFSEMAAFLEIAERGSFAAAATHLGIAPSTLSRRIRLLEERLGVRLLNRTTRSVAITAAGQALREEISAAFHRIERAAASVAELQGRTAGRLRLTVAPPAAGSIVGPLLARFLLRHPEITLEVSVDGASVDIVRERFDAGIRLGALLDGDMIGVRLGPAIKAMIVASPRYVARKGRPKTPQDLRAHECIRVRVPSGALLPWRFQVDGKIVDVDVDGPLVVNDRELELKVVLDGVGVAHTLSNRLGDLVAEGKLVSLLEEWAPPPFEFYLYHPSRRQTPPPLRAFIDFLRAEA